MAALLLAALLAATSLLAGFGQQISYHGSSHGVRPADTGTNGGGPGGLRVKRDDTGTNGGGPGGLRVTRDDTGTNGGGPGG